MPVGVFLLPCPLGPTKLTVWLDRNLQLMDEFYYLNWRGGRTKDRQLLLWALLPLQGVTAVRKGASGGCWRAPSKTSQGISPHFEAAKCSRESWAAQTFAPEYLRQREGVGWGREGSRHRRAAMSRVVTKHAMGLKDGDVPSGRRSPPCRKASNWWQSTARPLALAPGSRLRAGRAAGRLTGWLWWWPAGCRPPAAPPRCPASLCPARRAPRRLPLRFWSTSSPGPIRRTRLGPAGARASCGTAGAGSRRGGRRRWRGAGGCWPARCPAPAPFWQCRRTPGRVAACWRPGTGRWRGWRTGRWHRGCRWSAGSGSPPRRRSGWRAPSPPSGSSSSSSWPACSSSWGGTWRCKSCRRSWPAGARSPPLCSRWCFGR